MGNTQSTKTLPQPATAVKVVAVYCRVSTENQETEGTSLDTQRAACLKYCQDNNYQAAHQFIETWSGLSLERPKLDELRQLVRNEEISAVVIYSLDRLTREPNHGVILRQEREKHHVELLCVTETVDSSKIGQLIQYIYDYASSLEADRLRDRMTRGIRARVFDKKLPITFREPYGYKWDRENLRLVPNSDYDTLKLILNLAMDGKSYDFIIADLKKRGIYSPSGLPEWNKHTISSIIHNPVYSGQFHAFKSQAVTPKKRNGKTYGKTSVKRLPQDQWHYMPGIEVVEPPITLDQRALLLDQLRKRQNTAKRNANANYLLRGRILCETHQGKQGKPRVYHGQPYHGNWRYVCPAHSTANPCVAPYLNGPELEEIIKKSIIDGLYIRRGEFYKLLNTKAGQRKLEKQLKQEIKTYEERYNKALQLEAQVETRYMAGEIDSEVYPMLKAKYHVQRLGTTSQLNETKEQLSQVSRKQEALLKLKELRDRLGNMTKMSNNNWSQLLNLLSLEIHICDSLETAVKSPFIKARTLSGNYEDVIPIIEPSMKRKYLIWATALVPLNKPEEMWDIAIHGVERG